MAPVKMTCKNNEKFMYTGKEMSPLGLGFCADAENVGTQMLGRDGKTWIVGIKNSEKIWIRAPEKMVLTKEEPVLEAGDDHSETEARTPTKPVEEKPTEAPGAPEKPKRKYVRKPKVLTPVAEPIVEEPEGAAAAAEEKPKKKVVRKLKLTEEAPKAEPEPTVEVQKPKAKAVRKAPAEKAGSFEEGYEKEGADGATYVVKADKNGTKKWMKKTEEKKVVTSDDETKEAPVAEEKPKRKYTRKLKTEDDDAAPKKERKKRGPTAYNLFIGAKLKELREKTPGKETTVYMREALDIWAGLTEEEKKAISQTA